MIPRVYVEIMRSEDERIVSEKGWVSGVIHVPLD
jgi:hypothetical protein